MADVEENLENTSETNTEKQPEKIKITHDENKAGIIYFSKIPSFMNVKILREMMEQYGEIGRIFLQPDAKTQLNKKNRKFNEGWIEFRNKKIAKRVALSLNNTQIGGKRRSKWYEELWNMKYLSRFKWTHLNERLAYEREVFKQRMRTEIVQARKETNFFVQNLEQKRTMDRIKERKQKKKKSGESGEPAAKKTHPGTRFKQRDTEEEFIAKKRKGDAEKGLQAKKSKSSKDSGAPAIPESKRAADNKTFLMNMFSGGVKSQVEDS